MGKCKNRKWVMEEREKREGDKTYRVSIGWRTEEEEAKRGL